MRWWRVAMRSTGICFALSFVSRLSGGRWRCMRRTRVCWTFLTLFSLLSRSHSGSLHQKSSRLCPRIRTRKALLCYTWHFLFSFFDYSTSKVKNLPLIVNGSNPHRCPSMSTDIKHAKFDLSAFCNSVSHVSSKHVLTRTTPKYTIKHVGVNCDDRQMFRTIGTDFVPGSQANQT